MGEACWERNFMKKIWVIFALGICVCVGCAKKGTAENESQRAAEAIESKALEADGQKEGPAGAREAPEAEGQTELTVFTDDLGREVTVAGTPRRVAALIGSFADMWCLSGGKDTLAAAAADSFTAFDLGLPDTVMNLGAIKNPSLEILMEAKPDFVLASSKNTANVEMLETLEKAGIAAAYFDISDFDDYLRMLSVCTKLTGCPELYDKYGTAVKKQVEEAAARQDGTAPTVLYIRATGSGCSVKGSSGTVLGEMLKNMGCENVADQENTLLENLSLEAIMQADPDYIFVVLQGADPTNAGESFQRVLLSNPAWETLRAVKEGRFYQLEHSLYNLKPNERWGEAYEKLADILYPEQ